MHSVSFPLAIIPAEPGWRALYENGSALPVIGWALVVDRIQRPSYEGEIGELEFEPDNETEDGNRGFEAVVVDKGWVRLAGLPSTLLSPAEEAE